MPRAFFSRLKLPTIFSLLIIILIHLVVFSHHYYGTMIFPWDFFSSGYHGQAFAWYEDGSIFAPPTFFPYSSMGFPAWWSLQSGGWYLPLQFLHFLGVEYTFTLAAALQAFHVLLGAMGTYTLARILNNSIKASFLAGLSYHFSVAFFSNSEHVDIVRATALFPWLICFLYLTLISERPVFVVALAFIIGQFAVAAYPGNIVSAFYSIVLILCMFLVWKPTYYPPFYIGRLCLAGSSGILMALSKWLTPALIALHSYTPKPDEMPLHPIHLLTFLFRFGLPFLPNDITMQSLWLPPVALLLLIFCHRTSPLLRACLVGSAFALLAGSMSLYVPDLKRQMPGMGISRFALSDWRMVLHLFLGLATGIVFDLVQPDEGTRSSSPILRTIIALALITAVTISALLSGYTPSEIIPEICIASVFILVIGLILSRVYKPHLISHTIAVVSTGFVLLTSYNQYLVDMPQTWQYEWPTSAEASLFEANLRTLMHQKRRVTWDRRPARTDYGLGSAKETRKDVRLNRAWYAQEFTIFGYDNLGAPEYKELVDTIDQDPAGADLLQFAQHPSQVILTPPGHIPDLRIAATCPTERIACLDGMSDSEVSIKEFRLDGARYEISTKEDVDMIENELFYPGFVATLCADNKCRTIDAFGSVGDLRAWHIPAGNWVMTSAYHQPYRALSLWLAAIGAALPLFWLLFHTTIRFHARRLA